MFSHDYLKPSESVRRRAGSRYETLCFISWFGFIRTEENWEVLLETSVSQIPVVKAVHWALRELKWTLSGTVLCSYSQRAVWKSDDGHTKHLSSNFVFHILWEQMFLFQISMCKCCIYISACFPFVRSLMHVCSLNSMITVVIECYSLTWIFKY